MVTEGAGANSTLLLYAVFPELKSPAQSPAKTLPPVGAHTPLSSVLHARNAFPILYPILVMAKVAICRYFPKGYDYYGELLMRGPSCSSGKTGEGVFTWPSHLTLPYPAMPHPLTLVGLTDPPAEPSLSIPLESKSKAGSGLGKSYFIQLANGSHIPWERIQVWNRGDGEAVCVCVCVCREGEERINCMVCRSG